MLNFELEHSVYIQVLISQLKVASVCIYIMNTSIVVHGTWADVQCV